MKPGDLVVLKAFKHCVLVGLWDDHTRSERFVAPGSIAIILSIQLVARLPIRTVAYVACNGVLGYVGNEQLKLP